LRSISVPGARIIIVFSRSQHTHLKRIFVESRRQQVYNNNIDTHRNNRIQ